MSEIQWTDETWNPTTGCTKVSPGCAHCYIERTPPMRMAGRKFVKGHIPLRLHEDRLTKPLSWKKPRRVFVNSMSDLFHEDIPDSFIDRVFDTIWMTPQHTYQVLTKRAERAVEYMRERAYRRSFNWTHLSRTPLKLADTIHFDDLVGRNQCGYVGGGDWVCEHPLNEARDQDGSCESYDCPIAERVDTREELTAIGVADGYKFDSEGLTDDSEWMRLHQRPQHALPANLWLGFSAEDQERFETRARIFRSLRFENPFITLFCSAEPLLGPIDTKIRYHADSDAPDWSPLDGHEFQHGSHKQSVPFLNWVIVGGESGPNSRACDVSDIRSVVAQCRAASVPCFVKQLGSRPFDLAYRGNGRTYTREAIDARGDVCDEAVSELGKILDSAAYLNLRDKKGGDISEWPEDLRVREFPRAVI